MAHGIYRGTAFANLVQQLLRGQYYGGFGEGGQYEDIFTKLLESYEPAFEELMETYGHQAAGLGQAVPGEGFSGKAQEGERELGGQFLAAIGEQAQQAYQMPWGASFGGATQILPGYMGTKAAPTAAEKLQQPFGGCCFIFIEADDGILNKYARRYRNECGTERQKSGYKRLANKLVPLMKKSRFIKNLVRGLMVRPMIWSGKAFYGENNWGFAFWPLGMAWLILFDILGNKQYEYQYAIS